MPVVIEPSDVTNVAPELSQETEERLNLFIEIARGYVCESKYGVKAKNAIIFYTAHLLTLANKKGVAGTITQEKVGELSRSYSQPNSTKMDDLGYTTYGMMLYTLKKTIPTTPLIVG